ncbi:dihydrofolate reductase [Furfurilactobacillus entadae]|uniref:dihydrofolate reductase n=1 Tax=Furfurilactobacillus entadae TaxID=2922307 RepID=UPI0035EFB8F5
MLTLIWAEGENHVIGDHGQLPWHLPADAAFFKATTTGHTVLMGRTTFESIGRPLPHRKNVVLSSQLPVDTPGVTVVATLAALQDYIKAHANEALFVIGGVGLYTALMSQADCLLVTRIAGQFAGDTIMPPVDPHQWHLDHVAPHEADDKNAWAYRFETYVRI